MKQMMYETGVFQNAALQLQGKTPEPKPKWKFREIGIYFNLYSEEAHEWKSV